MKPVLLCPNCGERDSIYLEVTTQYLVLLDDDCHLSLSFDHFDPISVSKEDTVSCGECCMETELKHCIVK